MQVYLMRTVGHMLHLLFLIGRYINDDIKPKTPYFEFYLLKKKQSNLYQKCLIQK